MENNKSQDVNCVIWLLWTTLLSLETTSFEFGGYKANISHLQQSFSSISTVAIVMCPTTVTTQNCHIFEGIHCDA